MPSRAVESCLTPNCYARRRGRLALEPIRAERALVRVSVRGPANGGCLRGRLLRRGFPPSRDTGGARGLDRILANSRAGIPWAFGQGGDAIWGPSEPSTRTDKFQSAGQDGA